MGAYVDNGEGGTWVDPSAEGPYDAEGNLDTTPVNPYAQQVAAYNQANPLSQYGIQGDWQRVSDISYGPGAMYNQEAQRYDPTLGWMTPQQNINFSYGKSPDLAAQIFQGAIMSAIAAMTGGVAAGALGGASAGGLMSGGMSNWDLQKTLTGAGLGALGGSTGIVSEGLGGGLAGDVGAGALTGAGKAALTGGDIGTGALYGAAGAGINDVTSGLTDQQWGVNPEGADMFDYGGDYDFGGTWGDPSSGFGEYGSMVPTGSTGYEYPSLNTSDYTGTTGGTTDWSKLLAGGGSLLTSLLGGGGSTGGTTGGTTGTTGGTLDSL